MTINDDESLLVRCKRLLQSGEEHKILAAEKSIASKELKEQAIEHDKLAYKLEKEVSSLLNKHSLNPKS